MYFTKPRQIGRSYYLSIESDLNKYIKFKKIELRKEKIIKIFNIQFMRIRKFNESLDDDFIVSPITFNNSRGEEKTIYPSVVVDFIKTSWQTRDKIRKEMDDLMWSQGFSTYPKFVDSDGNIIDSKQSVIDINQQYPGFKWVFYVEKNKLEKSEEIADKYSVDFYKNK